MVNPTNHIVANHIVTYVEESEEVVDDSWIGPRFGLDWIEDVEVEEDFGFLHYILQLYVREKLWEEVNRIISQFQWSDFVDGINSVGEGDGLASSWDDEDSSGDSYIGDATIGDASIGEEEYLIGMDEDLNVTRYVEEDLALLYLSVSMIMGLAVVTVLFLYDDSVSYSSWEEYYSSIDYWDD